MLAPDEELYITSFNIKSCGKCEIIIIIIIIIMIIIITMIIIIMIPSAEFVESVKKRLPILFPNARILRKNNTNSGDMTKLLK